jgi:hypothetical protein
VNRCFSSERPNFSVFSFYFHPSGNKTIFLAAHVLVGVKTPIHLFTYSPFLAYPCLEIKSKNGKLVLVGVKTPIHLFTYSPFSPPFCLEIKSKNGKLVLVGVKTPIHLFTYSPFLAYPCLEIK